jgi:hypothetical protein
LTLCSPNTSNHLWSYPHRRANGILGIMAMATAGVNPITLLHWTLTMSQGNSPRPFHPFQKVLGSICTKRLIIVSGGRDIDDPTSGRLQDPTGTQYPMGLNSFSLPSDISHQVFEYRQALTASSTNMTANQAFVGREPKYHKAVKQFSASTAYTPSTGNGTAPQADQQSMAVLYSAQHHHTKPPQTHALGQAALSTIGLDQHWLSSQGLYTGRTLMCPYHDPIFQGNAPNASRGRGPMARYFAAVPSEQYAIFSRPDTGDLSTSKGCLCLEMLQLNIDIEEDTQE